MITMVQIPVIPTSDGLQRIYTINKTGSDGIQRIHSINRTLNDHQSPSDTEETRDRDLLRLLAEHRVSEATDARDKCIALLGLAVKTYLRDSTNLYSQSVREIYTSTIAAIAFESRQWPLSFLLYAGFFTGKR